MTAGILTKDQSIVKPAEHSGGVWLAGMSLCWREWVRFLRQRNRIIGALATPIVFWLLIGGGMGRSFAVEGMPGGDNYMKFFFPGTIIMILLFTAIFSTISIIEDRREGFLQAVLVAPVSRMAIVLGKVLGGGGLAMGQGVIFLLLAPLLGITLSPMRIALTLAMMAILSLALTGLGFCIAWRMSSTQGFHAIMNLFLMPMWFLSGALFPPGGAWSGLKWIMMLNPLTYGLSGLRQAMYWGEGYHFAGPGLAGCFGISIAFMAVMVLLAGVIAKGRVEGDLQ